MSDYRIISSQAIILIERFIAKLRPEENNIPLGGTILKSTLHPKALNSDSGSMSWYCWSEDQRKYPKLFLAFEQFDGYNTIGEIPAPQSLKLKRATNIFWYAGQSAEDIIERQHIDPNAYVDVEIDRDGAEGVIELKNEFLKNSPRDDSGKNPLNKYPYSFFENKTNPQLQEFINQPDLEYVRYYFGYDDVADHHKETNRIRIILVGVDASGTNLAESKAILLQNSWPPPPWN
jgi:hypothetical protein